MKSKPSTGKEIASTIIRQLGGSKRLVMFLGTTKFSHDNNSLYFNYNGSKKSDFVKVSLNGLDLYDVTFYKLTQFEDSVEVSKHENIYCFDLAELFENQTGLYLHF